ncbi:MAG: hypothetical protein RQ714_08710 [Nitrosomonas sp.]|nr:hypothetical protein [Nitrosomonas sp.]
MESYKIFQDLNNRLSGISGGGLPVQSTRITNLQRYAFAGSCDICNAVDYHSSLDVGGDSGTAKNKKVKAVAAVRSQQLVKLTV